MDDQERAALEDAESEGMPPQEEIDYSIVTFNKADSGKWRIRGPVDKVVAGGVVEVTRKNGEIALFNCRGVGEEFERNGVKLRYGYRDAAQE
jgi:hypothetical protein